ncbi:fimbrial protein, partial [Serratia fonticola]|nr:fimbrial protein [Serratia fonticola]
YRDGRMILKRPAVLGRNAISVNDLPGGYYSVEVRLVDRNGNIINRENHAISNVNFGGYPGYVAWHLTAGKDLGNDGHLLEGGFSRDVLWFFFNGTVIRGSQGKWATEGNITRPGTLGDVQIAPTLGIMSGEKGTGGYLNLSLNGNTLGNLSYSRYQHNNVSYYSYGSSSSALSYSRGLGGTLLSYNYSQYSSGESHQVESRWNYRPNGL